MADTLTQISFLCFAGAAVCLAAAIWLFRCFDISTVHNELARKRGRKQAGQIHSEEKYSAKQSCFPMGENETLCLNEKQNCGCGQGRIISIEILEEVTIINTLSRSARSKGACIIGCSKEYTKEKIR